MKFENICDGRERCEAFCAGPIENFPFYNQTAKKCINTGYLDKEFPMCGERDEAKYQNHQCLPSFGTINKAVMNSYQCLNRHDISENNIRSSMNYNKFVSARKNLFQYFQANDTRNQVNRTHIICGDQKVVMNCSHRTLSSVIECKKEETDNGGMFVSNKDVCDALDFLEDKGLPPPSETWMSYIYDSPQQLGM